MKGSSDPEWTHVRLRRATKERLEGLIRRMASFYHLTGRGPALEGDVYSVDAMVNILIDREDDHRERNRRAVQKHRSKRVVAKTLEKFGQEGPATHPVELVQPDKGGTDSDRTRAEGNSPPPCMECQGSAGGLDVGNGIGQAVVVDGRDHARREDLEDSDDRRTLGRGADDDA